MLCITFIKICICINIFAVEHFHNLKTLFIGHIISSIQLMHDYFIGFHDLKYCLWILHVNSFIYYKAGIYICPSISRRNIAFFIWYKPYIYNNEILTMNYRQDTLEKFTACIHQTSYYLLVSWKYQHNKTEKNIRLVGSLEHTFDINLSYFLK